MNTPELLALLLELSWYQNPKLYVSDIRRLQTAFEQRNDEDIIARIRELDPRIEGDDADTVLGNTWVLYPSGLASPNSDFHRWGGKPDQLVND
jgi:hypothetical protein